MRKIVFSIAAVLVASQAAVQFVMDTTPTEVRKKLGVSAIDTHGVEDLHPRPDSIFFAPAADQAHRAAAVRL